MPAIQDPRTAKEPRAPTAGRMKNRPGAAEPSGGALLSRAGCRGTCPPPAAGCMVTAFALDQKSRRRMGAPPPAALDGISIARFFGSKVQCSEQAEIFCDFPDKIPVPLLGSPLRDIEPQGCTKYSV